MKKILSLLILGIFVFAALNAVSALETIVFDEECTDCTCDCEINVLSPIKGEWYDPVLIEWEYIGEDCNPSTYTLQYQEGNCEGDVWKTIANLDSNGNPMQYDWDVTGMPDGEYCIRVRMDQGEGIHISGYSGSWYLDLTPPTVKEAYVSSGLEVPCEEDENCKYYINDESKISFACSDEGGSGIAEKLYRYQVNGGSWTSWADATGGFFLPEESIHNVEYYCTDNVGKESEKKITTFIVDLTAPEITRTVGDPKISADSKYEWFVNTDTEICVNAVDPEPHPVNNVELHCYANDNEVEFDDNGCFTYEEDSWHTLYCQATDALGNYADEYWYDIVDSQNPITTLSYTGPYYSDCYSQWIDGVSTVVLNAVDPEPHPVNGVTTYYRYEIVDDSYCRGEEQPREFVSLEKSNWMVYEGPFSMEESCHKIEYYSVDALGNTEGVNVEFVFVDKTAPVMNEVQVGEPSHDCNSVWEDIVGECEDNWDWKITMGTEVVLSCEDSGVHPAGIAGNRESGIWYRVILDGNEETPLIDWTLAHADNLVLQFNEESEHLVEYYCVDNVGKTSETSSTMFKVEGEEFVIELEEKWNLISIPFNLISSNIEEVLDQVSDEVETVWAYDETGWHVYHIDSSIPSDLETMKPGYGYWVKATEDTELVVGGSLLNAGPGLPPSRPLQEGWNLIGHYGLAENPVYCSLFSLVDTTSGYPRWSSVVGFTGGHTGSFTWLGNYDLTEPGKGYWVEMDVSDRYAPATACWGFAN